MAWVRTVTRRPLQFRMLSVDIVLGCNGLADTVASASSAFGVL